MRSFCVSMLFGAQLLLSVQAGAQVCDCERSVKLDETLIDGEKLGVTPGETICVEGGSRPFLRFYNLLGTAEAPVVIKNCKGQVSIDNSDRGYGLTLSSSKFVRITGSGDPAHEYGFRVRATRTGPDYSASCIVLGELSSDYELDHVEALDCGFAGVVSKTDPDCEIQDRRDFVQRNTRLHHLYLHDTGGEGIYFGNTGFPSREGTCDGKKVQLYPHTHEGVWIHDNLIEDTGWDGAQIGVSPKDCFFYRNSIRRVGLKKKPYQMQGLQIGGGSQCEVTQNTLSTGDAAGIFLLEGGNTLIANNVVEGFQDGIYMNDREASVATGKAYRVLHNTIVSSKASGIRLFGKATAGNVIVNNLVANGGEIPIAVGRDVDAQNESNLVDSDLAIFKFAPAASGGAYTLAEDSPAVDGGLSMSSAWVTSDFLGSGRDAKPDIGAFEYGGTPSNAYSPPTGSPRVPVKMEEPGAMMGGRPATPESSAGPSSADPGTSTEGSASADSGGCGLTRKRSRSGAWSELLFVTALFFSRRRRRKRTVDSEG